MRERDHFEFYWFPHTDTALTKTNTRLPADAPRKPLGGVSRWIDDELLANGLFAVVCAVGTVGAAATPRLAWLTDKLTGNRDFTDFSTVGVHERTAGCASARWSTRSRSRRCPTAVREVRALIERKGWHITFPIEVRAAASDDNWLSTAYGRETGYIAVHRYYREDPTEYFAAVEQIMRELRRTAALGQDAHRRRPSRCATCTRGSTTSCACATSSTPSAGSRTRTSTASSTAARGSGCRPARPTARREPDPYGVRRRSVIEPSTIEPTIHATTTRSFIAIHSASSSPVATALSASIA